MRRPKDPSKNAEMGWVMPLAHESLCTCAACQAARPDKSRDRMAQFQRDKEWLKARFERMPDDL